jgi:glycosyltransferase involved in cell wall biosynthesis
VKVLILHQHFNTPDSGGPLRSYYLAKALLEKGIKVAVITGSKGQEYKKAFYEEIEIHYVPVAYENRFGFYKRGLSFIRYAMDAVKVAGRMKDVSLCYAISVPLTVGQSAIWIERKFGIPFYFEVGDLWPEAPVQMGFVQNPFLKHSLYWLERRVYKRAKKIIALSGPIRDAIKKKAIHKEVVVIPNMADTNFYQPAPKNPAVEAKFGTMGKFVISYIGAVGFANGLDFFLECARACTREKLPIQFLLCGEGAMTNHLLDAAKSLKLDNIQFVPFQTREGVREVMNVTDATFICYRPFPVLETGSPNKYFDGLAAGKMIIVNFSGWIKDEIEQRECGIGVDSKNPVDIVAKLKPFLADITMQTRMRANSRKLAEEKYSREKLSAKFTALFDGLN